MLKRERDLALGSGRVSTHAIYLQDTTLLLPGWVGTWPVSRAAAGSHPAVHGSGSYLQVEDVIFGNGFHQVLMKGGFTVQAAGLGQSLVQQAALPARPLPVEEDIGSVLGEEGGDVAD